MHSRNRESRMTFLLWTTVALRWSYRLDDTKETPKDAQKSSRFSPRRVTCFFLYQSDCHVWILAAGPPDAIFVRHGHGHHCRRRRRRFGLGAAGSDD